jgi:hypothetical protein
MSETQIVNRTPETFGQKLERERLEAEIKSQEQQFQEIDNTVAQAEPEDTPSLEDQVRKILGVQSHAPRDPDLREFKEQVIRAFKHMGLDTVKFFS